MRGSPWSTRPYRIELNVRGLTGTVHISHVERLTAGRRPQHENRGRRRLRHESGTTPRNLPRRSPAFSEKPGFLGAAAGFSLLEVMLATSILLTCLIVLGQLASVGRRHARDAEQLRSPSYLCRSRYSEILAGAAPLESQPGRRTGRTAGLVLESPSRAAFAPTACRRSR